MRALEAIAPYAAPGQTISIKDLYVQRKWVGFYGGAMAYRRDNSAESALAWLSPDYNDEEIHRIWEGNAFATPSLLPALLTLDLTSIREIDVPLILLLGRHDAIVNRIWERRFSKARSREAPVCGRIHLVNPDDGTITEPLGCTSRRK